MNAPHPLPTDRREDMRCPGSRVACPGRFT